MIYVISLEPRPYICRSKRPVVVFEDFSSFFPENANICNFSQHFQRCLD